MVNRLNQPLDQSLSHVLSVIDINNGQKPPNFNIFALT